MNKVEFEFIKKNKRWSIKFADIYSKYFFIIFPFTLVIVGYSATIAGFKNNVTTLKFTAIIILSLGIFLTAFVIKRLYQNQVFSCIEINNLTKEKVKKALKNAGMKNMKYYQLGYFVATTGVSWFSWGEQITVIIDNHKLLINSRPTGSLLTFQPITIFKDKQNIRNFIKELEIQ